MEAGSKENIAAMQEALEAAPSTTSESVARKRGVGRMTGVATENNARAGRAGIGSYACYTDRRAGKRLSHEVCEQLSGA